MLFFLIVFGACFASQVMGIHPHLHIRTAHGATSKAICRWSGLDESAGEYVMGFVAAILLVLWSSIPPPPRQQSG
jgi:hypothetical protein